MVKLLLKLLLYFFLVSSVLVGTLKWINPPITSFMIQAKLDMGGRGKEKQSIRYQWVGYDKIAPSLAIAVIAAEDQNFPYHRGFDLEAIERAIKHNAKHRHLRGASTISQQTAKNLFLWPGRSFLRKSLEAYFTVLIELYWGKKRVLEVYLNVIQMGAGVFGVQAASHYYFGKTAGELSPEEAALLAAILPNPLRYSARSPSAYVRERKDWILRQVRLLGGVHHIRNL